MNHFLWMTSFVLALLSACGFARAQIPIAVVGETVYTMSGEPVKNGVILIRDGKIERVAA